MGLSSPTPPWVPAGAAGAIDAYATNDTDLIVDISGYFVPPAANTLQFYPLPPCRVLDTRNPAGTFGRPSITGGAQPFLPDSVQLVRRPRERLPRTRSM